MKSSDRDYFLFRAGQERDAAARSSGAARARHEELAAIYRMRVTYIDRGLIDEGSDPQDSVLEAPQIIAA